jgi:uncharacterized membrane-anchored protein
MAETGSMFTDRLRIAVIGVTTVVILALVNVEIAGKERIVRDGATVLLQLAPVDPRSLLQGDYMALRYAMADDVAQAAKTGGIRDGAIVIALDENRVAHFVSIYDGSALAKGQQLLQFRKRGETVRLAADAFFFEEGQGSVFQRARFGELRVAGDGSAVLVGLRGEQHELMGR